MRSGKVFLWVAFLVIAAAHEARPEDITRSASSVRRSAMRRFLLPRKRVFLSGKG
jgi:hypothetical protein